MSEDLSPDGPRLEITAQRAAEILGISVAHVLELTRNGVLASRGDEGGDGDGDGDAGLISAADVEAFAERRRAQLAAAEQIAKIVNRSPGGWDS